MRVLFLINQSTARLRRSATAAIAVVDTSLVFVCQTLLIFDHISGKHVSCAQAC